jgi:2-methylcitrate dehydratase PrpD
VNPSAPDSAHTEGTIAQALARFTHDLTLEAIPARVRERAKLLMLDAIGVGLAASSFDFAHRTVSGLLALGAGDSDVIGMSARLPLRDAVLVNGVLVHGLDFDDTSISGRVHASSSSLPCALGMAAWTRASGRELLVAYIVAMETTIRVGAVARGGFQANGWHPTGIAGAFGCALAAGRLADLSVPQLTMALGIAGSTAAGTREFVAEAAWTKRLHAGWAGAGGITAALLARHGFTGPTTVFEGPSGLYRTYLGARYCEQDLALATQGLGGKWGIDGVSIKPLPSCHFNHPFIDAVIALAREHDLTPADIASVTALVPEAAVHMVCEPAAAKRRPADTYAALFSVYYAIACALVRGQATLADHEPPVLGDATILELAQRVGYAIDPDSNFPRHYSGGVVIETRDGRKLARREDINRGSPERPLLASEIEAKFMDNARRVMSATRAGRLRDLVLSVDRDVDAVSLSRAVSAPAR